MQTKTSEKQRLLITVYAKHGSNKDGTDVIIKDVDLSSLSLGMPIGLGPMSTSQPHRNSLFNMNELS